MQKMNQEKKRKRFVSNYLMMVVLLLLFIIVIDACKKDTTAPPNPYNAIDYGNATPTDTLNPNSFTALHRDIFAVKCANPGCHDGTFEPDFRSLQSAYNTLVYHPVVKKLAPWTFRVVPYDTAGSWLWQRLSHEVIASGSDTSKGRMPIYSTPLSQNEMIRISNWIMNGAKNMFAQNATYPNTEPTVVGYIAMNNSFVQIDTNRIDDVFYNPFILPSNLSFKIVVGVNDDSTAVSGLINNKLKFSLNKNDFSSAAVYNGYYVSSGSNQVWVFDVNTSAYNVGDTIYMRYYTNDGDHVNDTEFPRTDLIDPWKTWWAFKIQ